MIPDYRWFPRGLAERAVWFANFNTQFGVVAAALGLAAKVTAVGNDNAIIQFLAASRETVETFEEALTQYRRIITEENIGDPTPLIPAVPDLTPPPPVATGIFQRLVELRTQIMAADAYTDEIGALLGILPVKPAPVIPSEVKLVIKVHTAATGYVYTVIAENRQEADSWDLYILKKGAASWEKVGTFMGKSIDLTFTPTTPGEPEQFQARIQGRRKNENYGQPSDPTFVTVNP